MEQVDETAALVAALLGITAAALGARYRLRLRLRKLLRELTSDESMQQRADRLTRTLGDTLRALTITSQELQRDIDQGRELVARLEADAHAYDELAQVNRDQAEAVTVLVRSELAAEGRRSFWFNFAMNVGFFLAGVAASVLVPAVLGS